MCTVSMVIDSARSIPDRQWDMDAWRQLQKTIQDAQKLDEMTGQKDCVDPEKAKALERIERIVLRLDKRMDEMERRLPSRKPPGSKRRGTRATRRR